MSTEQSFLWFQILKTNQELNQTSDPLCAWEKSIALRVMIQKLQSSMGLEAYDRLVQNSRQTWKPKPKPVSKNYFGILKK